MPGCDVMVHGPLVVTVGGGLSGRDDVLSCRDPPCQESYHPTSHVDFPRKLGS